jgi:sporulation and cell division protein SsgA
MDTTRSDTATFRQTLVVEICDAHGMTTPLPASLRYDTSDPYAVTVTFGSGDNSVAWTFGRDLLIGGLVEPTGDGDVHVWTCLDERGLAALVVELCSPAGDALVQFRPDDVASFVERMHTAVPEGHESAHLDVDGMIAEIMAAPEEA